MHPLYAKQIKAPRGSDTIEVQSKIVFENPADATAFARSLPSNRLQTVDETEAYDGSLFVLELSGSAVLDVAGHVGPYAFFGYVVNGLSINDGVEVLYTIAGGNAFMFFDDPATTTRSGVVWAGA